jgi:hypothetical protein
MASSRKRPARSSVGFDKGWRTAVALGAVVAYTAAASVATEVAAASRLFVFGERLIYRADPGEANTAVVTGGVRQLVVRDPDVTIRPGRRCRSQSLGVAVCRAAGVVRLELDAADGDDSLVARAQLQALMFGGAGSDRLVGGPGPDVLRGGVGDDRLRGDGGDDRLAGGRDADLLDGGVGSDVLQGEGGQDALDGGIGADALDGGTAFDTATYGARLLPVAVSLNGIADDGELGEGDNALPSVERIIGGSASDALTAPAPGAPGALRGAIFIGNGGDDALEGSLGADELRGGDGDDRISGGAGDDYIVGGASRDSLDGGPDSDIVGATDGVADSVDCGDGTDFASLDSRDSGARSCERDADTPGPDPRRGAGRDGGGGPRWFFALRPRLRRQGGGRARVVFRIRFRNTPTKPRKVVVAITLRNRRNLRVRGPFDRVVSVNGSRPTVISLKHVPRTARRPEVDVK